MDVFEEIRLTAEESDRWIRFHSEAYTEDRDMAKKMLVDSPRWSIIIAYYSMHNISKLYLASVHNLKLSGESVHAKTIFYMSKYAKQEAKRIVPLLEDAKKEYDAVTSSNVWVLTRLLKKGRDERSKTQYYDSVKSKRNKLELMHAAQYFMDNFMEPYLKIIERLL